MTEAAPPLHDLYRTFAGLPVYFDELPGGNNGDQLIIRGSRHFHAQFGFEQVDRPDEAKVIIVRGNGVLTDFYANTPHRAHIQAYVDDFPESDVVIEPSTFRFPTEPAFRIPQRRGTIYLYARDDRSFSDEREKHAYQGLDVRFGVDDDMAFHLVASDWIQDLRDNRSAKHTLVVERHDIENPQRNLKPRPARVLASRLAPDGVKNMLRPALGRVRSRTTGGFRSDVNSVLSRIDSAPAPELYGDISNPRLASFDDFVTMVQGAQRVFTQRLHVGVLAALIGTDTWLDDRGYFKINGIWRQSMSHMKHVHLMSEAFESGA